MNKKVFGEQQIVIILRMVLERLPFCANICPQTESPDNLPQSFPSTNTIRPPNSTSPSDRKLLMRTLSGCG